MSASFSNMPQPVTIPVFASSGAQPAQPQQSGWQMDQVEQDMDFDLLAEYLMDDNDNLGQSSSGMTFDFK
jgi:hypothetical protein